MLATGVQHGPMPHVIALVSALSVGDPFLHEGVLDQQEVNEKEDGIANLELAAEVARIKREEIRPKEIRKAKRQAFFRSQQVSDSVSLHGHCTHLPFQALPPSRSRSIRICWRRNRCLREALLMTKSISSSVECQFH
jgi:hypothetical protein